MLQLLACAGVAHAAESRVVQQELDLPLWPSAEGFQAPAGSVRAPAGAQRAGRAVAAEGMDRRSAVATGLGALGLGLSQPASAGFVTSLGLEVTKPSDADIDDDLLKSRPVQKSLENLRTYKKNAAALKQQLAKTPDMELIPTIRKQFDFAAIRDDLNVATTVFDDQTQLTIDRLSRGILYDLTELENSARFKKGAEQIRTPKKIDSVNQWFTKFDSDTANFLTYFGKYGVSAPPTPAPTPPPTPAPTPAPAPAPVD